MWGEKNGGFTLVEVLVALAIFAFGLISIAGLQITALRNNSSANSLSVATALAEGVMEEILALPPNNPLLSTAAADQVYWATDTVVPGGGIYRAIYSVDVGAPVANVSRVSVVVQSVGGATTRQVSLTALKRTTAW